MSKRTIKTVDDARQALVDLTPDGFRLSFDFHYSWHRNDGHTFIAIDLRAHLSRDCGSYEEFPTIEAHSPADIVRKFVAELLPKTRPREPEAPGPVRGHVNGRRTLRITHEPKPFRPGELFG